MARALVCPARRSRARAWAQQWGCVRALSLGDSFLQKLDKAADECELPKDVVFVCLFVSKRSGFSSQAKLEVAKPNNYQKHSGKIPAFSEKTTWRGDAENRCDLRFGWTFLYLSARHAVRQRRASQHPCQHWAPAMVPLSREHHGEPSVSLLTSPRSPLHQRGETGTGVVGKCVLYRT